MQRITTLQCAIGAFCALLGSLMLVAPHQFGGPLFVELSPHLPWIGPLFFVAGVALPGCAVLGMPRRWIVASHLAAAAALSTFIVNFALIGTWPGVIAYLVLASGTALAPFLAGPESARRIPPFDYFALVFGALAVAYGAAMLLFPLLLSASAYDLARPYLTPLGAAFLLAGAALLVAQLRPALPPWLRRVAHLSIVIPCVAFGMLASVPLVAWSGILLYFGFSLLVASLPWTGPRLRSIDPRSFAVRMAFALVLGAALPLVVIMGIVTGSQEQQVKAEAESRQEALAIALASDVSHFIGAYRGAMATLADYPGLLALSAADQQAALRSFVKAFPATTSIGIADATGRQTARSDDLPLASNAGLPVFEEARRTNSASMAIRSGRDYPVPLLLMGAPIRAPDGTFAGNVASGVTPEHVSTILNQVNPVSGSRAYLVDAAGHAIAHLDQSLVANFADLSATPVVAAALASAEDSGIASSAGPGGEVLAGFARAPGLAWTVVVDRPARDALAAVRGGRDAAFGLLLVAILLAAVAGVLMARRLSAPLAALSWAAGRLARGDDAASLPRGGASEIEVLVDSFGEMRDKLAARAVEREGLLAELGAVFASLAAPVIVFDSECKPVRTNPAALARYGIDPVSAGIEEFVRRAAIRTPEGVVLRAEDLPGIQAIREKRVVAKRLLTTDSLGKEVVVQVVASPLVVDGQVQGAVGVWHDVTEQERLLAAEQEARTRAETAVRVRDEFISIAAHELKTPVTSLRGFSQVLLRKHEKTGILDPDQVIHALTHIDEQTRRFAALTEELLNVSRLEAGRLELARRETEVGSVIESAIASVREVYSARAFLFRSSEPLRASLDPLRMEQVLVNILDNAARFSPKDAPVEIEVSGNGQDEAVISVRDHGPGIAEGDRERVFERFYQAHPGQHYGGMGLGLYISREIVRMHGGTIACEAAEGGGARFVVCLPLGGGGGRDN